MTSGCSLAPIRKCPKCGCKLILSSLAEGEIIEYCEDESGCGYRREFKIDFINDTNITKIPSSGTAKQILSVTPKRTGKRVALPNTIIREIQEEQNA